MISSSTKLDKQQQEITWLLNEISALQDEIVAAAPPDAGEIEKLHPAHRAGAVNMLHYLALRQHDIRPLQEKLARLGLSSLGRSEAHVLASVKAQLWWLGQLAGQQSTSPLSETLDFDEGTRILARNTDALLGPAPNGRSVRIMVTLPGDAANDANLIREIIAAGCQIVRINCAHDDHTTWTELLDKVRAAERELDRKCLVLMDLAGPKLRTGALEPGPAVVKWKPERNPLGQVVNPAPVWLLAEGAPAPELPPTATTLTFPVDWVEQLEQGDLLELTDARGARRFLEITTTASPALRGKCDKTAYITEHTGFRLVKRGGAKVKHAPYAYPLHIAAVEQAIVLNRGDRLILTTADHLGRPAMYDQAGKLVAPASIGCTLPEVFPRLRRGEAVLLDDGKFEGHIVEVNAEQVALEITQTPPDGAKLHSERSINFPASDLGLPAMMPKDYEDLKFIAAYADIVGLSFIQRAEDVLTLQRSLAELTDRAVSILLKIETRGGFEQLPELLWAAMRSQKVGVMIARGDLAVECGYERLAEVQEEILWLCEAAHLPVVWATQVLENLARSGQPSRAEITDAAMGERAECVMLNKGPHIIEAIVTLDNILHRMRGHLTKKSALMRRLRSWSGTPWLATHT